MEKKQTPKTNHHPRGVIHHLSHRTRYRIAHQHRNPKTLKQIHDSVASLPGVKKVEVNDRTGSILIHHEEQPEILPLLEKALNSIAVDLFVDVFAGEEMVLASGVPLLADLVKSYFARLNNSFAHVTQNYLDLKTLLPLLFLGAGLYQTSQNRTWWKQMPAWVLFYYAFDSYMKFHGPNISYGPSEMPGNGQDRLAH